MSIQFKRGTGTANDTYTGLDGSISIDFTNELIRVHNGDTAGGVFSVGTSTASGTDLSVNYDTESFTISSGSGTDAVVSPASVTDAGAMSSVDKDKLDGIETEATADQTEDEIKTLYESNADTNAFTDAEKSKLVGIEEGAEVNDAYANQSKAETGTDTTVVMSPLRTVQLIEAGNYVIDEGVL